MRVLIDECIPKKFQHSLRGLECKTVPQAGFAGKRNGMLLTLAENAGFDVLITVDKGIPYQQSLHNRSISLLVIRAYSNELESLLPHVEACLLALNSIRPGQVVVVG